MSSRGWKFLLYFAGALILFWGIHYLWHLQEKRVLSKIEEAAEAIQNENPDALLATMTKDFSFQSTVAMVGNGDWGLIKAKLGSFWQHTKSSYIFIRDSEVQVQGEEATASLRGNLRFEIPESSGIAIYKYAVQVSLKKIDGDWRIFKLNVTELTPGLF